MSAAMDARFAAVTKRISVMQSLLQGAALSELPVVSQIQTRALLATLQSVQCCGNKKGLQDTAGDWLAKVAEMCGKLRDEDFEQITKALATLMRPHKKASWSMQHFCALPQYYAKSDWNRWNDENATPASLQLFLFSRAEELGCRHPSENTTKLWTSMLLARFHGILATSMQVTILDSEHQRVKAAWKKFDEASGQTGQAASGVESLPTSPVVFQQDQPDIFKRVYGNDADDQPVICPIDLVLVNSVNSLYGCRGLARLSTCAAQSSLALQLSAQGSLTSQPSQPSFQHRDAYVEPFGYGPGQLQFNPRAMMDSMQKTLTHQILTELRDAISSKNALRDADMTAEQPLFPKGSPRESPTQHPTAEKPLFRMGSLPKLEDSPRESPTQHPSADQAGLEPALGDSPEPERDLANTNHSSVLSLLTARDKERRAEREALKPILKRPSAAQHIVAKPQAKEPRTDGTLRRENTRDQWVAKSRNGKSKVFKFHGDEAAARRTALRWLKSFN